MFGSKNLKKIFSHILIFSCLINSMIKFEFKNQISAQQGHQKRTRGRFYTLSPGSFGLLVLKKNHFDSKTWYQKYICNYFLFKIGPYCSNYSNFHNHEQKSNGALISVMVEILGSFSCICAQFQPQNQYRSKESKI